jgi:hypothetical protein
MDDPAFIDYSSRFPKALAAHGRGRNVLILTRLPAATRARFDRKPATYQLEYRWLSRDCTQPSDEAHVCVRGSETTFWQRREIGPPLFRAMRAGTLNLFEHFNLF